MISKNYLYIKQNRIINKTKLVLGFGGICCCCNLQDDIIVYDFHHLNSKEKNFLLSEKIRSWKKIAEEAKKCVMVCAICHRKLHSNLIKLPKNPQRFDQNLIPNFIQIRGEKSPTPLSYMWRKCKNR